MTNVFPIVATKSLLNHSFLKKFWPLRILPCPMAGNIKYGSCNSLAKHYVILSPKLLHLKARYPPIRINQFVYNHILQNHFTLILLCFVVYCFVSSRFILLSRESKLYRYILNGTCALFGSCHFRGVWATCLPYKGGGVSLRALPKRHKERTCWLVLYNLP